MHVKNHIKKLKETFTIFLATIVILTVVVNIALSAQPGEIKDANITNVSNIDIVTYYRGLGNDPSTVETSDLLKAAEDWKNNIVPPGFSSSIVTDQLLLLAYEWRGPTQTIAPSPTQTKIDSDGDGIPDYDELHGFAWNGVTYYTDPFQISTSGDPYSDYQKITGINMPPTVLSPGRYPLVPAYADLKVNLEKIDVNTLTKITSTKSFESDTSWNLSMSTEETTKEDWGISTEVEAGFSGWSFSPYGHVKVNANYDYSHIMTSLSTYSSSGWSKEEWSSAIAFDNDKAARLKFHLKLKNDGTDAAKNIRLRFNIKIGNNTITTVSTDNIADRIDIGQEFPATSFVVEKDEFGNPITITFNELKSIELGAPLKIEILETNADVPWKNNEYRDWKDYEANINRLSTTIVLDTGSKVKEYKVFSGIRYPAQGDPYYFMNISLENATLYALGAEKKDDGIYIGGQKVDENWRFGFDNNTFSQVQKFALLNKSFFDMPIRQGMRFILKAPDTKPPEIHWVNYKKNKRELEVSVTDNEHVRNVTLNERRGNSYQNFILNDEGKDSLYNVTLPGNLDLNNSFVTTDDGRLTTRIKIVPSIKDLGASSIAYDINNKGLIIGFSYVYGTTLWENGTAKKLANLSCNIVGFININRKIVCNYNINCSACSAIWQNGNITDLGISAALDINDHDQIVGIENTKYGQKLPHAILLENGEITDLGTLPGGNYSIAYAINDLGNIVGQSDISGQNHATLWKNGEIIDLGTLPGGNYSSAVAINNNGQIVGYSRDISGRLYATLWEDKKITNLGTLPGGTSSYATAINNNGQIVGYSNNISWRYYATLWEDKKIINLGTLPGETSSRAVAINNNGQIVGYSIGSKNHAILWER